METRAIKNSDKGRARWMFNGSKGIALFEANGGMHFSYRCNTMREFNELCWFHSV